MPGGEGFSRGPANHFDARPMTVSLSIPQPVQLAREGPSDTKMRLGWFSTWNSRCGIAEYSKYLLGEFNPERFDWTVLASRNDVLVAPDEKQVIRCWSSSAGAAEPLLNVVLKERFDVLVVQFKIQVDFGFLSLQQLEALIACCHCAGTRVVLILHATDGADPAGNMVPFTRIAQSLSTADRILVHSQADVGRLRAFGVEGGVELFPHGYLDLGPQDQLASRQAHQLPREGLIIGSHGFLLPHKGIDKLISALKLLRCNGTRAKLLLVTALYPTSASEGHLALCRALAAEQGVADDVIFETRFLPREVSLQLLAACDVIVYPYQISSESVSGAIRLGLASRRPVICSPQPIFSDVSTVVRFLRGLTPNDICEDLQELLSNREGRERLCTRQAEWVEHHSWPRVAQTLQEILRQPTSNRTLQERNAWIGRYVADVFADRETSEYDAKNRIAAVENDARVRIAAVENDARARIAAVENDARARIVSAEQSCQHWQIIAEDGQRQVQEIYRSNSWRITRPLRGLSRLPQLLRSTFVKLRPLLQTLSSPRKPLQAAEPHKSELSLERASRIAQLNLSLRAQKIYLDLTRAYTRNKLD